ncbi:DNA repair protein RecN [Alicyclobacillus shizuokensis]|uniref:DNA repair protein RecN n=1 Tax=Alicyclobacillus shizuokensis TaxID=392014 RepID=UPI000834A495|nr:DNA repair protein RecN [Alicyclobacillus shizuokensis]MCL6626082.1 DNA repair protein RecN [Alicyclobacillus shizuokensis]
MLLELSVQRIALIESLHIHIRSGLTVFTGETGAGKSILLDSIGLLLGNRASSDWIRSGCDDAVVEALFEVDSEDVRRMLSEWGFTDALEEPILLSRTIHRSGRSVCRINGRLVTVQMLRELGMRLVQQHGQHEHQGLVRSEEQLRVLDLYGGHERALEEMQSAYQAWREADAKYREARMDEQERARRLDMLSFQIQEIEGARLRPGEEEELRERRARLQNLDKIYRAVQQSLDLLDGSSGAVAALTESREEIAAAVEFAAELRETVDLLETAQVHAEEAAHFLSRFVHQLEADPQELEQTEARLAEIRALERKYGTTEAEVLQYYEEILAEHQRLLAHDEQLAKLAAACERRRHEMEEAAEKLHRCRLETAARLSDEIEHVLRSLDMEHARFAIDVRLRTTGDGDMAYSEAGADQVVFLFSANKGEELRPLARVASGGELSRTMLAVKSVLAEVDGLDTLIFDEIDTGVSGSAVHKLATVLRRLGHGRQVLCVTHSPQIAAAAVDHYVIRKQERETDTISLVERLDEDGRIREVARLIGSDLADATAFTHARALVEGFAHASAEGA